MCFYDAVNRQTDRCRFPGSFFVKFFFFFFFPFIKFRLTKRQKLIFKVLRKIPEAVKCISVCERLCIVTPSSSYRHILITDRRGNRAGLLI